jgi:hypothetical protein
MSEVNISVYDENLEVKPTRRTKIIAGASGALAVGLVAAGIHVGESGGDLASLGLISGVFGGIGAFCSHIYDHTINLQSMVRKTRTEAIVKSIAGPPDITMYESAMTIDRRHIDSSGADEEVGTVAFEHTDVYKTETGAVYVSDSLDFAVTRQRQRCSWG